MIFPSNPSNSNHASPRGYLSPLGHPTIRKAHCYAKSSKSTFSVAQLIAEARG